MKLNKEFFSQTWLVVVLSLVVYPVGMILVWTNSEMKKGLKIALTVLGGLILLTVIITDNSEPEITLTDGKQLVLALNQQLSAEELVSQTVSDITDNRTEMSLSDIKVDGYDDIDFTTEGWYYINYIASDKAGNEVKQKFTIEVKMTDEQRAAQKEAKKSARLNEQTEEAAAKEKLFSDAIINVDVVDEEYLEYFEASNTTRFQYGSSVLDGKKWRTTVYYLESNNDPKSSKEVIVTATSKNYEVETLVADYKRDQDSWTYIDAKYGIDFDEHGVPLIPEINEDNIKIEFSDFVVHLGDNLVEGYGLDRNEIEL